jgi:nanoRNase/pAp phosphatase (c-di-AMP/oligoRNAs hydrolase)
MSDVKKLEEILKANDGRNMAIVVHDEPDLDAIGSAEVLKKIAEKYEVHSDIIYKGEVTNIENQSLINHLGIELVEVEHAEMSKYSLFAMVDVLPDNSNLSIREYKPSIIIDHHEKKYEALPEQFVAIEKTGAACSIAISILTELGMELDREKDQRIIQACYEGLKKDTNNFVFSFTKKDLFALGYLVERIDETQYKKLRSNLRTLNQASIVARAILSQKFDRGYSVAPVGVIDENDFPSLSLAASSLLEIERIDTAIVYGLLKGDKFTLAASIRNVEPSRNAGDIAKRIFGEDEAGGNKEMAGAKIKTADYLKSLDAEKIWESYHEATKNKIRKVLGIEL